RRRSGHDAHPPERGLVAAGIALGQQRCRDSLVDGRRCRHRPALRPSVGIGGIGGIAPERRSDLARLGVRAMIGGTIAAMMTGGVAGVLL
ncbi:MAG: nucleoside transporter C-terminal domain-containing protein, partial [Myxococcota bacterium]|nr:nucleoside transporter C-terminal domain-containing protein [Myxococcota bacterium]